MTKYYFADLSALKNKTGGNTAADIAAKVGDVEISASLSDIVAKAVLTADDFRGIDPDNFMENICICCVCPGVTSITFPDDWTTIPSCYDCYSLTSVTLPSSLKTLPDGAFGETGLTEITLPVGLTEIPEYCFEYCPFESFEIPDRITKIGQGAFCYCTSLISITLPGSIEEMGEQVFYGCTALESATFGDQIREVSDAMFYECTALKTVILGSATADIGSRVFIGCSALTKLDCTACTDVPTLGSSVFNTDLISALKIVVPDDLYDEWIAATNWSNYASNIVKASEYTE